MHSTLGRESFGFNFLSFTLNECRPSRGLSYQSKQLPCVYLHRTLCKEFSVLGSQFPVPSWAASQGIPARNRTQIFKTQTRFSLPSAELLHVQNLPNQLNIQANTCAYICEYIYMYIDHICMVSTVSLDQQREYKLLERFRRAGKYICTYVYTP